MCFVFNRQHSNVRLQLRHVHGRAPLPRQTAGLEQGCGRVQLDGEMDEDDVGGEEGERCEPQRYEDGARTEL